MTPEIRHLVENTNTTAARRRPLLTRAKKALEEEDAILAQLVAERRPKDERAFRLALRAQWRAVAALWAGADDADAGPSTTAEYVEMLRDASTNPQDTHDARLAAEFAELMSKIAA